MRTIPLISRYNVHMLVNSSSMARYWGFILREAFSSSLKSIGQTWGTILFSALCLAVVVLVVLWSHGFSTMKRRLAKAVVKFVLVPVFGWLPFFLYQLARTPYVMGQIAEDRATGAEKKVNEQQERQANSQKPTDASRVDSGLRRDVARLKAQEEKGQVIRELAEFANEGVAIRDKCLSKESDEDILKQKAEWERRVVRYLSQHLGEAYVARFRNSGGQPLSYPVGIRMSIMGTWGDIEREINILSAFLEELSR